MKKIINLMDYKHIILKRKGDLLASKGIIDQDAYAEDARFETRCWLDEDHDHCDLGFVMRENAEPYLFYLSGKFCQSIPMREDGFVAPGQVPAWTSPHKTVAYTGLYQTYYPNGSIEIEAEFKNGLLDGRYMRFSTTFQKIDEYHFLAGQRHGLVTLYRPTGTLISQTFWCHGARDVKVLRYNDEKIQKVTTFFYEEGELFDKSN